MLEAIILIAAYILGAIPFGRIIAKAQGVDITQVGSGNIGATNVHRVLGKKAGLTVFALDLLKGLIPSLAAKLLLHSEDWAFAAGFAAILGHTASPFLGFKGGKGISTGLGVLFGTSWPVALAAFGIFLIGLWISRYVSAASIAAGISLPLWGFLFHDSKFVILGFAAFALYIVIRHRQNIIRLREGSENRFTWHKGDRAEPNEPTGEPEDEQKG